MCPDAFCAPSVEGPDDFEKAVDAALDQCRQELAAALPVTVRNWTKKNVFGEIEPVTAADLAVQRRLVRACREVLPMVPVIAEECQQDLCTLPPACVVIDPIDGTVPFLSGSAVYTISVCLVVNGRPSRAAVDLPAYGIRVWARAGHGLAVRGDTERLPAYGPSSLLVSPAQAAQVRAAALSVHPVPTTSAKMVFVALSRASAALRVVRDAASVAPWDYAAAALIVREAGATVLDDHDRDLARCATTPVNGWFACRRPDLAAVLRPIMMGRDAGAL